MTSKLWNDLSGLERFAAIMQGEQASRYPEGEIDPMNAPLLDELDLDDVALSQFPDRLSKFD